MKRGVLSIELDAAGKAPPTEFRIFAAGFIETTKGVFKFDGKAATSVMAAAKDWGNDYCVDYGHSMLSFFVVDPAEGMKAAGWFKPELRAGELWASRVQWTEKAAGMLKAREARYISPAFNYDDDGSITELVNVALTNIPATKNQIPLVASKDQDPSDSKPRDKEKSSMKKLSVLMLGALGLSANASDAEAIAALNKLQARAREADELAKEKAEAEGKLNAVTGKQSYGESLGVVLSWKESAGQVEKLSTRIIELEQKGRETEVLSLVDQGVKDGKIAPAQKEMWLGIGKKDVETLKGFLATASKVVPGAGDRATPPDPKQAAAITDEQKKVAEKLGIKDPKALQAIGQKMADLQAGTGKREVELQQAKPAAA